MPTVSRRPLRLVEGGALVSDDRARAGVKPDDHEAYLKLCALDLDDEQAILEFARDQGPMGIFDRERRWFKGFTDHPAFESKVVPALREASSAALATGGIGVTSYVESLADFRWGATCIRDLVRAWRWVNEANEPDAWESQVWEEGGAPATQAEALALLERQLSVGLGLFHPQLGEPPEVTLYDACCLQLYGHIVEEERYRVCHNETCGRLFVQQSGRSEKGGHRSAGVKYCSAHCARAQAQRAYRRRKKAA